MELVGVSTVDSQVEMEGGERESVSDVIALVDWRRCQSRCYLLLQCIQLLI